jgi:hypothetical protein
LCSNVLEKLQQNCSKARHTLNDNAASAHGLGATGRGEVQYLPHPPATSEKVVRRSLALGGGAVLSGRSLEHLEVRPEVLVDLHD